MQIPGNNKILPKQEIFVNIWGHNWILTTHAESSQIYAFYLSVTKSTLIVNLLDQ